MFGTRRPRSSQPSSVVARPMRPFAGRALVARRVATAAVLLAWSAVGCGGRTAMDGEDETAAAGSDSGGGSGETSSATGGSSTGGRGGRATGGASTGGRGGRTTGGTGSGDIRDCLTCAMVSCSTEFTDCLTSTACTDGLWCAATNCTSSADPVCLLGCFEDPAGALEALALVSCVSDNCGTDCLAGLAL